MARPQTTRRQILRFAPGLVGTYEDHPWDEDVAKVDGKFFVFLGLTWHSFGTRPDQDTRRYIHRRRAEGKTLKEAMRCLKRHLCNVVYRQMVSDWRAVEGA